MANDWSMCLIAKTNPKWHAEKQIHHQEQELQARVTAVYTTTRWPSALFSCSMSGSSKPQSASQHLSSVTKQTTSCSCRKCWRGTEFSWVNSSSYQIQGIRQTGWHAHTPVCTQRANTQTEAEKPKIHSQGPAGQMKAMQCNSMRSWWDLPWDTTLSRGIMGLKEEEVKLWKSKGCGKAVRVTGCVCVCVRFNGVFWCDESGTLHEIKTTVRWHNSPTDRRFLCVPEIHAPPSRCLVWGCRGSDLQRASCWADWATASPSHPAPPSAHHLDVLNVKNKTRG